MDYPAQREQFAAEGYAVFERILEGPLLDLLREECGRVIGREDARLDSLGVEVDGISHKGKRYFAGECQRRQPDLRTMLFSETMADICRATLGDDAYFFYDQYVVKGASEGMPFSWHRDSGYVVGNGGPADLRPYLTCWCTLDDTTVANGTVRILPLLAGPETRDGIVPHIRQPGRQRSCRLHRRQRAGDARGSRGQRRRFLQPCAPRDRIELDPEHAPRLSRRNIRLSRSSIPAPTTCAATPSLSCAAASQVTFN